MKEKDKQGFGQKTKASLKRMEKSTLTGTQSNGGTMSEAIDKYAFTDDDEVGPGKEREKKRISHNTMEKKRKDKISKNILQIQAMLPAEYRSHRHKDSLHVILEKTAVYIQDMQQKVQRCMMGEGDDVRAQEVDTLRKKVKDLTEVNNQYMDLLRSSDVPEEMLLQPELIKQWKSKGKSSSANQTAAAADSTNQSSPEPEMPQEKESDWSTGSKRNRGNTVQEHLKRMEGMREGAGGSGDNPSTMEMPPFVPGFPRMLPGGPGMPLIIAGPNGQPQILPAGMDPNQMGMFVPPGMPYFPGGLMPQQQTPSDAARDLAQNDDPLMTLARAAGSSPMLSPTPQTATTSTTEPQEEPKGSEPEGASSSTDILSRAVSQSGMQLSPEPQPENPEVENEDKDPIVSASTGDEQPEVIETNAETPNANEMSQPNSVGENPASNPPSAEQQPLPENPAGPPSLSMPLPVPPVSQGMPSIPPLQMGSLQGRLILQNGQLILLNDTSQPNMMPGSSTAPLFQPPQTMFTTSGPVSSAGGMLPGSMQFQPPLMSVAKQPGQLSTQLPGQQIQGQLPGQQLQQLGNQPLPGLQQLPGQQLLGQQFGGQQLGMPGFQMPNLILNGNGQLILTNPQQMFGPQPVGNDGQLLPPGPLQGNQLQPGPLQPGPLQPGQMQPGQMQPGGPIQPGSLVGVKNGAGAPGNLPQALLLPNGQIVPVVTQPSMLFPGCQSVPGGVLLPKNAGATMLQSGGGLQQPISIPGQGMLQSNASNIFQPSANMSVVMTSVVTTVSPALPSVTKPLLQAGPSGLVSGVRPSLISVSNSKSPVITTSIGPPASMATSVNNDGGENQPPVIVSHGQSTVSQPTNQTSTVTAKSDMPPSVPTTTAHLSNTSGASTTAMAILNPDGTLVLTLPPGAQPNNLVLDPNSMPGIKTSAPNPSVINVKKGGKKSGQRVLMPKPTISGGIMTLPGIPVPSLAPTIIQNAPPMQNLVFTPPVSAAPEIEKPRPKPPVKPEPAPPPPLVVNVDPPVITAPEEVPEKKAVEPPDLLAQATESIFSSLSEISPPVNTFYQPENDEDALQIDTSAQEMEDTSQTAPQMVLQEERLPTPPPPVSSSLPQEAPLVPPAAPSVVQTETLPPKKKKKKKKPKTDKQVTTTDTPKSTANSNDNAQPAVSAPVSMVVTTAQTTLPSESVVTMTTASEVSLQSVACTTQVPTVSESTFSMPSYFSYPMTPQPASTIDASALLSPPESKPEPKPESKPKKSKKKKESASKEPVKPVEPEKVTPPERPGPLESTPKAKKKTKRERPKEEPIPVVEPDDKQMNTMDFFPESISFCESDLNSVLDQVEQLGSVVEPVTPTSGKKKSHKRQHSEGSEGSPKKKKKKKKRAVEEVVEETNDSFTADILEKAMKDIGPLEMDLDGDGENSEKNQNQSDLDLDKSISDQSANKLNDSDDGPTIMIPSRSPSPVFSVAKDITDASALKETYGMYNALKDTVTSTQVTSTASTTKDTDCALNKGANGPYGVNRDSASVPKSIYGAVSASKDVNNTNTNTSKDTASKDDLRFSTSDVLPSSLSILSSIAAEPIETTDITKSSSVSSDFPKSSSTSNSSTSRFSYNASDPMSNFSYAPKPYGDIPPLPDVSKPTVPQHTSVNMSNTTSSASTLDSQVTLTSLSSVSSTPLSHARHSNIATIARGITPTKLGPVPAIASKMARYQQQQQQQKMQQQQQQQQNNQQQTQQHTPHSKSNESCSNPLSYSSCSEMQNDSSKSTHNEAPSCAKENPMGLPNVPLPEAPTGNNSSCKLAQGGGNMSTMRPQVGGAHDMMNQPRNDGPKEPVRAPPPSSRTPKSSQEDVSGSEASPRSSSSGTPALHIDTFSPPASFSSRMLFSPGKGPQNHPSGPPPGGAMSMPPPNPPQQPPPIAKPPPVMTSPPQQPVKPPGPPQMPPMQPQMSQPPPQMSQPPPQPMSQQQPVMPPPPLSHQTPPSMQNDPKPHHHPNILSRGGRMEKEQPPPIPPIQVSSSDHSNSSHGNRNSSHKQRSMYSEGLPPVSNQPAMTQAKDLFMTVTVPSNMPPYNNNVTDMRERGSYSRSPGLHAPASQSGMSSTPYSTSSGTSTFSFTLSSASSSAATTTTPSSSNATYGQFPSHFPFYPPGLHPHQAALRPNHPGPHLGLANFMAARDMRPPHYLSHPPRPGAEALMSPHQQRGGHRYQEQETNRRSNTTANAPPSSHNSPYTSDSSTYRGDKEMSTPLSHSPMNSSSRSGSVGRSPHPDVPAFFPGHPGFPMMPPVSHAHQTPSSQSPGSLMATPPLHHRGNQGSSGNNQGRSYEGPPHLPHGAQFNFSPPGFEPPQLHLPPRETQPPVSRGDHYSSQMMQKQQNQPREDNRKQSVPSNHGNNKQSNVQSGQGSQKRSKQSKKQRQYEIDTNLSNSIFESGRSMTPLFPMPSISPPPRNPEAPTYLSPHLFGNSSRPLSSSTPLQHKGNAPSELNFNPLFPSARPQNSLGLNFQHGFGMNPAMHGQMPAGNQVPAHSGHFLSNLFPDVNPAAVSQAADGLNISPIKFPPHLSHQPMDHNLGHSHQPSGGMYGQRPHPSHHPPVLHNMSINTLLGHGPHGPPMGPPINSSMASAFGGHAHASFGMPLNFPLHEH